MLHHHHQTLHALAHELTSKGEQLILDCCNSLSKTEFHIRFYCGNSLKLLRLQWAAGTFFISVPDGSTTLPRRSIKWFREAEGQNISKIETPEGERVLQLTLENGRALQIQAFGPNANVVFKNSQGELSAFRFKRKFHWISVSETTKSGFVSLQFFICKEVNQLPSFQFEPCDHLELSTSSVIEALNTYQATYLSLWSRIEKMRKAKAEAQKQISLIEKRVKSLETRLKKLENSRNDEHLGHLIMNHLHELNKGDVKAEVLDYKSGENILIKLKPDLTPYENAERLYRKARNSHIEIDRILAEMADLQKKLQLTKSVLIKIEEGVGFENTELPKVSTKAETEKEKFRFYEIHGYRIYVGKNAKNNDELTFGFAKKDDLWFHARGFGGSHVVVKKPDSKPVPRPVIEAAAKAAAWHSQGKREKLCPVAYTERKNIRKPRGAAPGAVNMEREIVLMVEPEPLRDS